jgi:hypothetical protein
MRITGSQPRLRHAAVARSSVRSMDQVTLDNLEHLFYTRLIHILHGGENERSSVAWKCR